MRSAKFRLALLAALAGGPAAAQEPPKPKQWAVVVAVGKHDDPGWNLALSTADGSRLRAVLTDRGGVPPENLLHLADDQPAEFRPTLANIRRHVPAFLKKPAAGDRVLFFFAGHGVLHGGETYLVPADYDAKNPAKTGVPAAELRAALNACPATAKCFALDCCHAGGARAAAPPGAPAESVAQGIVGPQGNGCVVLASCRADEQSWEWAARGQGVFSYWFCRGLEGGADANADGTVDVDELFKYVEARVVPTAREVFKRSQQPVRVVAANVAGVPPVLSLLAETPESACRRLAEHLDLEARGRKVRNLGVLEFTQPGKSDEDLKPSHLTGYFAAKITEALEPIADVYRVAPAEAVRKFAAKAGLRPGDIGDPAVLKPFGAAGGLDAVVVGSARRQGARMKLECRLVRLADGEELSTATAFLPLTEDALAANGYSFTNTDRPKGGNGSKEVVEHAESQAHPRLDPKFPFEISVWKVDPKPGEAITAATRRVKKELETFRGDDPLRKKQECVMTVTKGETLEIRVKNTLADDVAMTLLVDGVNTLGKKRERPGAAWSWVLGGNTEYAIEGWYDPVAKRPDAPEQTKNDRTQFTLTRFVVTDAAESVSRRKGYGEPEGLITAVFYKKSGRKIGIGEGPAEARELRRVDFQNGDVIAAFSIRYVEKSALK